MANQSSSAGISTEYKGLLGSVSALLEEGRRSAAKSVNAVLTATYWLVGKRIVEYEQVGQERAAYGSELLKRLSADLGGRFGRGFSERNLEQMRLFYLQQWANAQTPSAILRHASFRSISQTPSAESGRGDVPAFPLSWSHYVRLLSVPDQDARRHYEEEALRGGWSVRQLDRQISTLSFHRSHSEQAQGKHEGHADFEIKDPFVLEFLGLKDEYSEAELEKALIRGIGAVSPRVGQRLRLHRPPKAIAGGQ